MNFIPKMNPQALADGYRKILATIYSRRNTTRGLRSFSGPMNRCCSTNRLFGLHSCAHCHDRCSCSASSEKNGSITGSSSSGRCSAGRVFFNGYYSRHLRISLPAGVRAAFLISLPLSLPSLVNLSAPAPISSGAGAVHLRFFPPCISPGITEERRQIQVELPSPLLQAGPESAFGSSLPSAADRETWRVSCSDISFALMSRHSVST